MLCVSEVMLTAYFWTLLGGCTVLSGSPVWQIAVCRPVNPCYLHCRSSQLENAPSLDYGAARAVLSELKQDAAQFSGDVKPQQPPAGRKHSAPSPSQPKLTGKLQREMCEKNTPPWSRADIIVSLQYHCIMEAAM